MQDNSPKFQAAWEPTRRLILEDERQVAMEWVEAHPDGLIPSHMLTIDGAGSAHFFYLDPHNRQSWETIIAFGLKATRPNVAIIVSEAWMANIPVSKPLLGRVRDLPADDRIDTLQVVMVVNGRHEEIWYAEVNYPPGGKTVGEFKQLDGIRVNSLLPERW